jgi:hypothetical protein
MMMKYAVLLAVLLTGLGSNRAVGALIGDPAPPLEVYEWGHGGPVAIKPGTNIYVLEILGGFMNPASRASVTNLNQVQARFKTNGVVVVGIIDQPLETNATSMYAQVETNIAFALGFDKQRQTAMSYLAPLKQRGVPYTFVVGTNGNVLWHGRSFDGLNQDLERIIAGKYDADRARKREIASQQMDQYLGLAIRGDFRAKEAGQLLLANRTNDVELLTDMAYVICTVPRLANRNFELAGTALDQAEKLEVTNKAPVMIIRAIWLFESGKSDAGLTLATQALASAQSPVSKTEIQRLLHTLEVRDAKAKARQSNTNQVSHLPASHSLPVTNTNQSTAVPDKTAAATP